MSSELNEQEPAEEQRQEQASTQQERLQDEPEIKDVPGSDHGSSRRNREVVCVVLLLAIMIATTFVGVFVAVKNANETNTDLVGNNSTATAPEYRLPVKPEPIVTSDQQELDMIISELSSNIFLSEKASLIPNTVAALLAANTDDADPYIKAAAWITSVDTMNVQQDVVARFVLATIYYINFGASWKRSTNWMTATAYHCDWYGVNCCEEVIGSVVCQLDSFGQVVELDLYKNDLAGPIPTSVVLLPYLHAMYLNENSLTGSIPGKELVSMTNFGKLYAQYNYLNGTLPEALSASTVIGKCRWIYMRECNRVLWFVFQLTRR
jgi:hypothetical protein